MKPGTWEKVAVGVGCIGWAGYVGVRG